MANKLKWTDWSSIDSERASIPTSASSARAARAQFATCLLALVGLALVVPGPASWGSLLSDGASHPAVSPSIGSAVEAAVLVVAGVLVWTLLTWVAVVWLAAIAGSLPGTAGRHGRAVLRRIAPAAAGRIVAAAVGVSLLAGTSACAVPALSVAGAGSGVSSTATTASWAQSPTDSAGPAASVETTTIPVPSGGGTGMATADDARSIGGALGQHRLARTRRSGCPCDARGTGCPPEHVRSTCAGTVDTGNFDTGIDTDRIDTDSINSNLAEPELNGRAPS